MNLLKNKSLVSDLHCSIRSLNDHLVRNELHGQLESYESKLYTSTKSVEELKRENAKTVRLEIDERERESLSCSSSRMNAIFFVVRLSH